MPTTADVVIIGGGCMGVSTAYHLARLGITDVVLLEREATLGAGSTGRNAGGVRHQFSHEANVRLSIESIRLMEQFEDAVGSPIDLHQDGYLFLLSEPAHVESFRAAVAMQRRLGVEVEWLDADEAARRAPGITVDDVVAATFCARDGISDPNGVTMGFAQAARRLGVTIRESTAVTGIRASGGRVTAVETDGDVISTRTIVNAAGPWAAEIGRMAGVHIPVEPLRRHIFLAEPPVSGGWERGGPNEARAAPADRVMVIDMASTFYFHREGAQLLFGMGDPDERPGFDISVDWSVLEKIEPVAARRLPVLADLAIASAWAGLYEMTPDAMPIIGPSGVDGLFVVAGFSGHGFQHSPAAGRIVADVIAGMDPGFELGPFRVDRFGGGTAGEVNVV
ncbi:MAG: NAD(P)/FAD-dependent oxidoreductase [Gemmatimonadales bacterium]